VAAGVSMLTSDLNGDLARAFAVSHAKSDRRALPDATNDLPNTEVNA